MKLLDHLPLEEKYNVYTHFFGAVLSVFGTLWLGYHLEAEVVSVYFGTVLYCSSLVVLFLASTIYHSVQKSYRAFWQKVDHIAIYGLIAGTYTPVGITVLYQDRGLYLIAAVWMLALIGLGYKLFFMGRWQGFSLFLYLAMGWLVVLESKSVYHSFSQDALFHLIAGGIFFTVGVVFYRWHSWRWHHVMWHLFVLAGAFFHFLMVKEVLSQMDYL